jgi:predicted DNA-binding protein
MPSMSRGRPREAPKQNFSVRLPPEDVKRVKALAEAHEWPIAKVIQKLVKAALDATMLK